jgi:GxxExxY protein
LGYGFLEKVYENSLMIKFQSIGLNCLQQTPIKVYYLGKEVGSYYADILVENKIVLEIKAGKGDIVKEHESQLLNYLKATTFEIGPILHFGEKPTLKRVIFSNDYL